MVEWMVDGAMDEHVLATALLEASPDGLLLVDESGTIQVANPSAAEIFGHRVEDLVGLPVERLVPTERRADHVAHRDRYVRHPASRPMGSGLQLFAEHADGSLFPVEISLSPITSGEQRYTIATVRDVTEREQARSDVALLEDRERIARDLHDMVIQRLFAAGMSLQAVAGRAEPPIVAERVQATIDELDDTIRELRETIFRLGSATPGDLAARLTEIVHQRTRHLGFEPVLEIVGPLDDIPEHVGEQLLATVTEGLSNVSRHARASTAIVSVRHVDGELTLKITDDGVGLAPEPRRRGGLTNMVWRAAELGGTCTVCRASPTGTRLTWRVPT